MHPCVHLLLAAGVLFQGSPAPQGGGGASYGKTGAGTPSAGASGHQGSAGSGTSGIDVGLGEEEPFDPLDSIAPGGGNTGTIADLFSGVTGEWTGGTVIYEGPEGTIQRGPFRVQLPGEPPIVTPDEYILVTVTGTPTAFAETFIVMPPEDLVKGTKVPLLVAFHKCCNTMFDITVNTTFAEDARARGWFMMAPLGAATANFSSIPSQLNTEFALDMLLERFGEYIDLRRVYGVGFSMGGGNALNYAARHVDTRELMFAAIVNHTGGLDLENTHDNDTGARPILEIWNGGTPAQQPFNYHRSSVVVEDGSMLGFARNRSLGRNLAHVPVLDVRAQFDSPGTAYLLDQNALFESMMALFGGDVTVDIKAGVSVHKWSTLEEEQALSFLEQHTLTLPTSGQSLADRDDRFFWFDITQDASGDFTPFEWEVLLRSNMLRLEATSNLAQLRFDPLEVGLSLSEALFVSLATQDDLADTIVLDSFEEPPVEVLRDGIATAAWTHDPVERTLTLNETDGTALHLWQISSSLAAADVGVSLLLDETAPVENTNVEYTVVARNRGKSVATGVRVDDLLPAGLTFVAATPDQGTYSDVSGEWDVGTLGWNDVATLGITATVDVGTGGDLIQNTASVGALTQIDPVSVNDSDSISLTVSNDADLEVTKTVDDDRPKEGEQVVYTISVTNLAPGAQATSVTLSDSLPSGVTYVSDVPSQGSYDDGLGVWTIGTLNSGATATLDLTASVDPGTLESTIVNTASVLGLDQVDPNATNDSDSASLLVVDDVDLAVTKVVDDAAPHELDTVVYTVTVTNTSGSVNASAVELTDVLPAGVTYVSDTPSQGSYSSGSGLWQVGALAAGANATLDLTVTVDAGTGGTSIVNATSGLTADQPDPNATNDSDSVQIDVDPDADLSVTKVVDVAAPAEQDTVVFTITVANPVGGAQATTVTLTDLLPAGLTYVSDVPSQGSYVSGTGLWTIGTIAAGASATLDITATVDVGTGGSSIVNTANGLSADQPDPNAGNDSDTAQVDVSDLADLAVDKVVDEGFPRVAENVVYTITVSNPVGAAQATNVVLTDVLPAGLTYVSDTPSQGSYASGTGLWTVGTIAAGASATLDLTASVDAGTVGNTIVNTTSGLGLDQTDPNATNDVGSASLLVVDDVDLSVTKVVDVAMPTELSNVVWTITVTNTSSTVAASTVSLTDQLPAGVTYVSDVPSQGSYDDASGVWTVGALAPLANATLAITAQVDAGTGGAMIVNATTALSADQPDPNATNDTDSAQIDVDDEADLSVTKVVDDAAPNEQQAVVYTITVANPVGGAQASTVSLTDQLPAGVTYVSDVPSQGSYDSGTGVWTVGTIAAGANATLAITASVDVGTGGTSIVNTTSGLTLDQTDSNPANDSDSAQIDVDPNADLSVTKDVDVAAPAEQGTVVYTITIANPVGAAQATGVSLTDQLPAGVTYVSDSPSQGSYVPGTGVWTVGTIDAGSSATLDLTATVDVATGGSLITNTANGLKADQPDPNATNDSDTADITVSNDADLAVDKVVDDPTPLESGTVVYTVTVSSPTGAAQATNVSLTDLLPAGVTYVSDVPSQGSYVPGTGVWTIGTLAAGANATLAITATVDVGTGGDAIVNTATGLTLDQNDPNALNDSDTAQIDVDDAADLAVTKVVDDAAPLEQGTIVYTLTLENTAGGAQASSVTLSDPLPAGVTYVSDVPSQGSYDSGTGLWTVGTLDTGTSATLAITATVDAGTGGTMITNTASSPTLDQTDGNPVNDSDSATITVDDEADLAVTKVVDDATPREGDTVVWTITIDNPVGGARATNVSLTDLLPAGVTYVSDSPSQGSYVDGTGIWTVGTIDAGASATLDLTTTVDAGTSSTSIVNATTALGLDQTDPNAANDTDSAQIDVEPDLDLSVSKVVDEAAPTEQDTIVYTITVTNNDGTTGATGIELTDLLPSGVTYVSDVPSQGSYVPGTGVWTVGSLAATSSATLDITATVDVGTGGDAIVNTTAGLTFDQFDSNAANDVGSVQIDVENEANLSVTKVVDDGTPTEQQAVVFTITVANPVDGAQATSVALTDLLPAGLTYVSDVPSQGSYVPGTGVWTVGTIDAGSNATLAITASVDVGTGGSMITNTASGLTLDQDDPSLGNNSDSATVTVENEADLAVSKVVDDPTPRVGDTVVYTVTVTNPGGGAQAMNVSLTDALPSGVTYVSDVPSQGSYVDGTGVWTVGTIDAGSNATLAITATVDAGQEGNQITNTTSGLTADQTDSNASNDVGSVAIDVEEDVDLSVSKTVDDAAPNEQDTIVYTITITNNDAADGATGITLTDVLPAGVTYVSDVPSQGSFASGTGVWTVGSIAALGTATLDLTVTVDVGTGGDAIVNTTSALGFDQSDANAANDTGSVQVDVDDGADLAVSKTVDDATPDELQSIVYTITVTNPSGGAQATGVSITDVLPSGVTYVSDSPSQGSFASGTGVWTVGTIDAGSNATLDLTVTVDSGTSTTTITNTTSSLTLDQTDANSSNDVGSVGVTVN